MLYKYGKRAHDFFDAFLFFLSLVCYILGAFLIKQLFHSPSLDMRYSPRWLSTISYPTCPCGIIVKYRSLYRPSIDHDTGC